MEEYRDSRYCDRHELTSLLCAWKTNAGCPDHLLGSKYLMESFIGKKDSTLIQTDYDTRIAQGFEPESVSIEYLMAGPTVGNI